MEIVLWVDQSTLYNDTKVSTCKYTMYGGCVTMTIFTIYIHVQEMDEVEMADSAEPIWDNSDMDS